jgi:hypothetical protein
MTQKRKSRIGLLVALVSPWPLYLAGLRGINLVVAPVLIVLATRLVLDIIWPDSEDQRP